VIPFFVSDLPRIRKRMRMSTKNLTKVVCWWSGGITSAVACKIATELFGLENCRFIMIDTKNEDDDTYRFKNDCEGWYGKEIEVITAVGKTYENIQDIWIKHRSLNLAVGASCSLRLKRLVREDWEKNNSFDLQVFGFDIDEPKRAKSIKANYEGRFIFPLLRCGYSKRDCLSIVQKAGIEIPRTYKLGYLNNNCFKTGCVQGGIGYWQKMKREFPEKFDAMAEMEHRLTALKGKPVTMLKDQSNKAKQAGNTLVFLKKHRNYPHLKELSEMTACKVEPLFECNGFCGTNDLQEKRRKTEKQINFEFE